MNVYYLSPKGMQTYFKTWNNLNGGAKYTVEVYPYKYEHTDSVWNAFSTLEKTTLYTPS